MSVKKQLEAHYILTRYITEVSRMLQWDTGATVPVFFSRSYGEKIMHRVYELSVADDLDPATAQMLWRYYQHTCELYAVVYIEADATDEN